MQYYKIIQGDTFIGVVSSNDFIAYQPVIASYLCSNEQNGELVSYNGLLYRSSWMKPLQENTHAYTQAEIISITEEQYNTYRQAIDNNETIHELPETDDLPPEEPEQNPEDITSIEFIRSSKILEMSYACRKTIEDGFDLELRGETYHFSLSTQDQLNLMNLNVMAQTQSLIPYHADGEECTFYTNEEINLLINAANSFKTYHTTYYNALKTYINALNTIEEIAAITYGIDIPEQYKSDVLKIIE